MRIALVLWFVSSFFILVLLGMIDRIIHNQLYDFGLQFSYDWATSYWVALGLICVCLAVPSILGGVALGLDLWKRISERHFSVRRRKLKSEEVQPLKGTSMLIFCPSCKKTFSKPMVIRDFSHGKPKLVNLCPYCSAVLGDNGVRTNDKTPEIQKIEAGA